MPTVTGINEVSRGLHGCYREQTWTAKKLDDLLEPFEGDLRIYFSTEFLLRGQLTHPIALIAGLYSYFKRYDLILNNDLLSYIILNILISTHLN